MHVYAPFATVRFAGTQGFVGSALGKDLVVSGTADLIVTKDLAITTGYVTCDPETDPGEDDGESGTDGGSDGADGPTDPPPPEPN